MESIDINWFRNKRYNLITSGGEKDRADRDIDKNADTGRNTDTDIDTDDDDYDDANNMDDFDNNSNHDSTHFLDTNSDTETDSDEEAGRVVLAFDPSQLTSGGDNGLPQNGHDYLRLVQEERAKYPQVISCNAPPPPLTNTKPSSSSSSLPSPSTSRAEESQKELDNNTAYKLKYHQEIINNFKSLKAEIEVIRQQEQNCDKYEELVSSRSGLVGKRSMIEKEVKCSSENNINRLLRRMELGYSPTLSDIIDKDQFEIHQTLEKLADECEMMQSSYRVIHTDWIYSLMAALRDPIEADITSALRRLAKICIKNAKNYKLNKNEAAPKEGRRGEVEEGEEKRMDRDSLNSCLLIICIVRHHFGQMDLK